MHHNEMARLLMEMEFSIFYEFEAGDEIKLFRMSEWLFQLRVKSGALKHKWKIFCIHKFLYGVGSPPNVYFDQSSCWNIIYERVTDNVINIL